jgi:AcrR family transcriptional regulator
MIYEENQVAENLVAPALQDRSKRSLQRIITAAELILRRDGFAGFSIAAIAEVSGVSIGGIYARVKGKPELYQLLKDSATERLTKKVKSKVANANRTVDSIADAFVNALTAEFARDERLHRALLMPGVLSEAVGRRSAERREESVGSFVEALQRVEPRLAQCPASKLRFIGNLAVYTILMTLNAQADDISWNDLNEDLRRTCRAYLQSLIADRDSATS